MIVIILTVVAIKRAGTSVTRYEKRDRSGFFVDSAFLVWIVSSMRIEFNGASLTEKFYSEAEL